MISHMQPEMTIVRIVSEFDNPEVKRPVSAVDGARPSYVSSSSVQSQDLRVRQLRPHAPIISLQLVDMCCCISLRTLSVLF